jgi:outer membrane biosynthesis protein TonB
VDLRRIIGSGVAASAIVHLSFVALVIFFSEVRPFSSVTAEPISVDIVTPDEAKSEPPPKSDDTNPFDAPGKLADQNHAVAQSAPPTQQPQPDPPPATPGQQAAMPMPQSQPETQQPETQQAETQQAETQQLQPQQVEPQQPVPPASQQAYVPAQPDLSVKYHVMLGLPQKDPGDGFDAVATQKADVASGPIAEFRRHLKTCSTLPKSVSATDKVAIKLRVLMTPDGRLAAPPQLIEASASTKGPALMQSAMNALQACQPYTMLPADKYREWRVLDLNFTPGDFTDAS